ncbi:hypothetical protein [Gottfriedia solisilvae]|uniref:hypothetical protein n=1 Tax=Gottfriedia solisilvae TaxID=1516104 RepID=UPI003D2EEE8D
MQDSIVLRNTQIKNKELFAAIGILEYVDVFLKISEEQESGKYIITIPELDWLFTVKVYYDLQKSNSLTNSENDYKTIGDLEVPIPQLKVHEDNLKLLFSYLIAVLIQSNNASYMSKLSLKINEIHLDQTFNKLIDLKIIKDNQMKNEVS